MGCHSKGEFQGIQPTGRRVAVRQEVKSQLDPAEQRLSDQIAAVDRKLDQAQKGISEILTTVIAHPDQLEHRVEELEEQVGPPRPH